jgi:type I restriction enzyme, R subunit
MASAFSRFRNTPIQHVDALVVALGHAIDQVIQSCSAAGVDLPALRDATGFEHIALRDAAVEALLADEERRSAFLAAARHVRKLFKALLPDPAAAAQQQTVAAIRVLAERLLDLARPPVSDLDQITDAVDELLDRSVGAEEYVIRAAAEGSEPDPLIDLSRIDFDTLAARFAGRKRAETDRLATLLRQRAIGAVTRNPTRYDLVERIEQLIADYNAGSLNIDEYLRRLVELSKSLTEEEQRAVIEGLTEEELAIFDLLTKPEPVLTDDEREIVKGSAKRLLAHLHDKLVLDWRRKAATTADVRASIKRVLDADLPADPYPPEMFEAKVQAVFDHIATAYGDDGSSLYDGSTGEPDRRSGGFVTIPAGPVSAAALSEEIVEQLRTDAEFVALVADKLGLVGKPELRTIDELIENDEDYAVEFKSTARWDLREGQPSKAMEDAVVKTIAGFLNGDGGTLLIGIGPNREVVGLGHDYARVRQWRPSWRSGDIQSRMSHGVRPRTWTRAGRSPPPSRKCESHPQWTQRAPPWRIMSRLSWRRSTKQRWTLGIRLPGPTGWRDAGSGRCSNRRSRPRKASHRSCPFRCEHRPSSSHTRPLTPVRLSVVEPGRGRR